MLMMEVLPKGRYMAIGLHGVTFHKTDLSSKSSLCELKDRESVDDVRPTFMTVRFMYGFLRAEVYI